MITLYGGRFGSALRCHWMLAELGLDYENPSIDMNAKEHKQAAYLAVNPAGQVPALKHDDFILTESAAIVHYLAEKHDPSFFGPMTPESHGTLLRWEIYVLLNIDKPFGTLAGKNWGKPLSPEAEAKAIETLGSSLPVLEQHLAKNAYLVGDTFTVADIVARCSFLYGDAAGFDISAYPSIVAWVERCSARPAFVKAKG